MWPDGWDGRFDGREGRPGERGSVGAGRSRLSGGRARLRGGIVWGWRDAEGGAPARGGEGGTGEVARGMGEGDRRIT